MNIQPTNTAKLKTAYKAPQLLVYGAIAELTSGGTGRMAEGNMNTMNMNRQRS